MELSKKVSQCMAFRLKLCYDYQPVKRLQKQNEASLLKIMKGGKSMGQYGEKEFSEDFDFFMAHHQELYTKYGHTFLAIKDKKILGSYPTNRDALKALTPHYPIGSFVLQECTGDESAFANLVADWQIVVM